MTVQLAQSLRIVIADDEPLARQRVRSMLTGRADCTVVGEARDGVEAVDLIVRERPDLVFLDVKMPELDGFAVLEALEVIQSEDATEARAPAIVFVTAFSEYAVKAFEVRAVDYLLKPFDQARFDRALDSAAARRARPSEAKSRGIDPELRTLLESLRAERRPRVRFLIRGSSRMYFVPAREIEWADAAGNYVRLHAGGRAHLYRATMKAFVEQLDPERFVRIHRSAIVNIECIAQVEPYIHGEYVVVLRDGTRLTSSRAHGAGLRALIDR